MKKALLISGGSSYKEVIERFLENSYIISVDSGAKVLREMGVRPDLFIGDFDSIDEESRALVDSGEIEVVRAKAEKDETDTELAASIALERGYRDMVILSATGTRLDHVLANINLLSQLEKKGINAFIVDRYNEIRVISESAEIERDDYYKYLSLMPFGGGVENISLKGTKYEVDSFNLEEDSIIGVSNEIKAEKASIDIGRGRLILIRSRD